MFTGHELSTHCVPQIKDVIYAKDVDFSLYRFKEVLPETHWVQLL